MLYYKSIVSLKSFVGGILDMNFCI